MNELNYAILQGASEVQSFFTSSNKWNAVFPNLREESMQNVLTGLKSGNITLTKVTSVSGQTIYIGYVPGTDPEKDVIFASEMN
mgnify:CR=1 FL=1|jgi:hypothetical protein